LLRRFPLLLVAALALAFSCSRETPQGAVAAGAVDESSPQDGGILIRRLQADVATLNPIVATSRYDRLVMNYIFTPLVDFDVELKVIPGLASKWEISPDGLEYTFHLNPKATFSDGTPVKASDVLFTLRKIIDPASEAAQIAGELEKIDMARTRVTDDHTIVVGFKEAFAPQLTHFNDVLVLPEHVYAKGDIKSAFNFTAIGSGPYRLVRRVPDKEIVLERREDYWAKKPYLQTVIFKPITDYNTAWNALKRGDIDETEVSSDVWAMNSTRSDLQKTIDFRRFYYLNYNTIAWNNRGAILSEPRVRRALAKCVDLKSVINNLYHGTARAMNGPFTPDQWAYNPTVPVIEFDPAGAQHDLNAAGWLDTDHDGVLDKDHKPLKIDLLISTGNPTSTQFAQLFQSELKKIGVVLTLTEMDPTAMIQRILAGNYDAAYLSWDLDPDPDPYGLLHSSQWPPHGQNVVFYKDPQADALIEAGRKEFNQSKRTDIYHRLHEVAAADQPYTWTVQVSVKWAISRRLHGVRESKGYGLFLWYPGEFDWWIPASQRTHATRR
jgi:peptide/nickel transport system substrate-binding protein